MQKDAGRPKIRTSGLVTVAYLKARLDEGNDHLGIFMPLVLDALAGLKNQSFTTSDIQDALASTHGIVIPQNAVGTLLKRASNKHFLIREAGRFRHDSQRELPSSNVTAEKVKIQQGQQRLGEALRSHATKRGMTLESTDVALDRLLQFLDVEQVALLLGNPPEPADGAGATQRERVIIAEFLHDIVSVDPALGAVLRGMLEGLVLYNAAFLPDLPTINRSFKELRVFFDSILVRQALGYEGTGMQVLMRETVNLLKASGVQCLVFEKTVHEIQRILAMYEERLATSEGRSKLRPVPMARYFLTQRYSPSDVREMSALLEREIFAAGFQIQHTPRRIEKYTSGEKSLSKRLADPVRKDEMEPRVIHDVDCVAGVLTLRRDHRSHTIEDVRVVFATSSSLVIRNTRLWWEEDEHETAIAPIVHIRALANLAWLKKPLISADFKVRELVALCTAAMRPTQGMWRRFLRHLESLHVSQRLTSDEVTAIVVSAMSDRLLVEAEMEEDDPCDIDAVTLDEVVERVKESYGSQAEERVRGVTNEYQRRLAETEARAQAATEHAEAVERTFAEKMRRRELSIEGQARAWARFVTCSLQYLIAAIVVAGAIALIREHPFRGGLLGIVVGFVIIAFVVLELIGILRHLSDWRASLEVRLGNRLRGWLSCDAESGQGPVGES